MRVFLVKTFGQERASDRRNENIIVPDTLKLTTDIKVRFFLSNSN